MAGPVHDGHSSGAPSPSTSALVPSAMSQRSSPSLPLQSASPVKTYAEPDWNRPLSSSPGAPSTARPQLKAIEVLNSSSRKASEALSFACRIHTFPSRRYTYATPDAKPPSPLRCALTTARSPLTATDAANSSVSMTSATISRCPGTHWPASNLNENALGPQLDGRLDPTSASVPPMETEVPNSSSVPGTSAVSLMISSQSSGSTFRRKMYAAPGFGPATSLPGAPISATSPSSETDAPNSSRAPPSKGSILATSPQLSAPPLWLLKTYAAPASIPLSSLPGAPTSA